MTTTEKQLIEKLKALILIIEADLPRTYLPKEKELWKEIARLEAQIEKEKINDEAKLREELIKYTIWHEELLFKAHALEVAIEHGVDEYLKQRNNG